ncbi:MAG: quinone-dependent dihydroorotate dehydrogenase [Hyphomicrobiales bacterium]|nr:quinone-dependent dihydroorotate dehydrogenase [Hyphomicrobiales bacterium]
MHYYKYLRPLLFCLSPETAHHVALWALQHGLVPSQNVHPSNSLRQQCWGLNFLHPVGLGAGFDKNAAALPALLAQGFSFVEAGTVTPLPQLGNPKPRLFRLSEANAIINRMGFNNAGTDTFTKNLQQAYQTLKKQGRQGIIGANIGKNKTSEDATRDYQTLIHKLYGQSDYLTINISSPNTPGLRDLQKAEQLETLLDGILEAHTACRRSNGIHVPLLVKIAPDLTMPEKEQIAALALEKKLDGLIVSNTTISRDGVSHLPQANETGGLSGAPLFSRATEALADMYRLTKGKIPLVGVGGIASGRDAYTKIRAGATLVQVYSALIFQGFELVPAIVRELANLLEKDGIKHIQDVVGIDAGR